MWPLFGKWTSRTGIWKILEEVLDKVSSCTASIVWAHWNCGSGTALQWASRGDELDPGWALRLGIVTVISTECVQQSNTVPRVGKLKCRRIFERKDCDLGFGKQDPGTLIPWVLNAEEAWQLFPLLQCQVRAWWGADPHSSAGHSTLMLLDLFTYHYCAYVCHVYNTCANVDGGAHAKARG